MPAYDFRTLSPADFELLVRDLLSAEHGWRLEAFGHGRDGGIDLRGRVNGAKIVVQCKHYAGSTFADLCSSARGEATKMDAEQPDLYLFATSQNLSRTQKDTLLGQLAPWLADSANLLTQLDLNELLGRHPQVERQHFKLWLASTGMLERIARSGVWERSEALMEDVRDRVRLYVRSPAFERSMKRLDEGHVVVLTGAPGVGKSTLAEMLLLAHWHEGWQIVSVSADIDEAWDTYRREEKQMFLYDDFLGQTDISERPTKNEDSRIVRFMERVAKDDGKRIIMTTRSQVLRQAGLVREPIARGNFHLHECLVELSDYGSVERARILYNHLYFSSQPRDVLRDYVAGGRYWKVVDHPNFSPRIIEQVTKAPQRSGGMLAERLEATLDRPTELWGTVFAMNLSDAARRIVLTLVTFPVGGVSPEVLKAAAQGDTQPLDYTRALRVLEGTFVVIDRTHPRSDLSVSLANPSVRDFLLATLDDEPDIGLQLLWDSVSLGQIQILLQYAASRVGKKLKFPSLAAAIVASEDRLMSYLTILTARAQERSVADKDHEWQVRSNVVEPLAAIRDYAPELMPSHASALVDASLAIADEVGLGWSDGPTFEKLTYAVVKNAGVNVAAVHDALLSLIENWGESLVGEEEVAAFASFVNDHCTVLGPDTDLPAMLRHYAENALREEIENISSNRTSEESDDSWLSSVEDLANRLGIGQALRADIESERSSAAEHYEERRSAVYPTSGAGVGWAPRQTGATERGQIGAMFRELT